MSFMMIIYTYRYIYINFRGAAGIYGLICNVCRRKPSRHVMHNIGRPIVTTNIKFSQKQSQTSHKTIYKITHKTIHNDKQTIHKTTHKTIHKPHQNPNS